MTGPLTGLVLALRALAFAPWRTALTVCALALPIALPWAVHTLSDGYVQGLTARATATPLVVGAPGSQVDLTLAALWLRPAPLASIPAGEADAARVEGLGLVVPLHLRLTARGAPVVGTTLEYLERRHLTVAVGTAPLRLGDATLGAQVAARLGVGLGDPLITDAAHPFDLARSQPVRLRVAGILAPAGGPDDAAVFVDLRTAWAAEGLIHGHRDVQAGRAGVVQVAPGAVEALDLTPERLQAFHLHGDPADAPLTALLLFPPDARARALLAGRVGRRPGVRVVRPSEVVAQLAGLVLKVRRLLDAHQALVAVSTLCFLVLVIGLGLRARADELRALADLGVARRTVVGLQVAEWLIIAVVAVALAGLAVWAGAAWLPDPKGWT